MIRTRSIVTLESKVFDKTVREQKVETLVVREAREFKVLTKQRMIDSQPEGRLYARKRGRDFRRFHRASARGQRPAIDSGKLLNSVEDTSISRTEAQTEATAPYAQFLNPPASLERPIMDEQDAQEAEQKMLRDANAMLLELI
jgi:hypothetical protein